MPDPAVAPAPAAAPAAAPAIDPAAAPAKPAAPAAAADPAKPAPAAADDKGGVPAAAAPAADPAKPAGDDPWMGLREKIAAGDDKKLQRLGRYATPEAAVEALLQLQSKIGSGELRSALPKDATPEQVAKWREENGIPESPDKYDIRLPEGMVIGKEDQELVNGFLSKLHGANANNQVVSEAIAWYYEQVEARTVERHEADRAFVQKAEDALRAEWGGEYRLNMNLMKSLLDTMPISVKEQFTYGRLANGDPLLGHPDVAKWLVANARQINPVSTTVPGVNGANISSAIDDEIASIENLMTTDRKAYNADDKKQARLRELYAARDKLAGKG